MVFRPSGADFQGMGVYRSDEGWGRAERNYRTPRHHRLDDRTPAIPQHGCFPSVVEGFNNKAKVTLRKSSGFRTFRITEVLLYQALGKLPESQLAHRFR